jgi:hypothetical protein
MQQIALKEFGIQTNNVIASLIQLCSFSIYKPPEKGMWIFSLLLR